MKLFYFKSFLLISLFLSTAFYGFAQTLPELMYFKFNSSTAGTVTNDAPAGTRAGSANATLLGLTVGGTGQFGAALQGGAGGGATASNQVNPGWTGTHTGSWTISFWANPGTPPTTRYYFGNSTGNGTFRCFIGGAANGIRLTGGTPTMTLDMPNFNPGVGSVITYVYNQSTGVVSGYINGVFQTSATPGTSYPLVGTAFVIGSQGNSIQGAMDEFRMYNRALTASEILATYNVDLMLNKPMNNASVSALISPVNFCSGIQNIRVKVKNNGGNIISNVTIQWQLDGITQTPFSLTSSLDTTGGTQFPNDTIITLGSATFNNSRSIKAWSEFPNFVADTVNTDDTINIVTGPALSGIYTIGGASPNYATIAAAVADLNSKGVCGPVVFNVAPGSGPYTSNLAFGNINGTSATNTITFNGNGNTITSTVNPIIDFMGSSYITLDSFNIIGGTGFAGMGVHVGGQSSYLTFNKNVINVGTTSTATGNIGFAASGSTTAATTTGNNARYITFTNNEVIGGYYNFSLAGSSFADNYGHYVANNVFRDFYVYGVYFLNADSSVFTNNDINRATRGTVSTLYGIYLNASRYMRIQKNRLHDFGNASYTAYPMYITNSVNSVAFPTEISNNLIYSIGTTANMYAIYSLTTAITNVNFYHNTIYYDIPSTSTGTIRGIFLSVAITNVNVKNNIIHFAGAGSGVKTGIYITTTSASFVSNNNVIRVATSSSNNAGYWTATRATLNDWQTASGQDMLSTDMDPTYTNAATGNLKPLSVPLDNLGVPVGVTSDILGLTRSVSTPDLGAYEFTTAILCSGTPGAGVAVANKSYVCSNDSVALSLSNDTVALGLRYQWLASTAGINGTYNVLTNDTLKNIYKSQTVTTWYKCIVSCSGNADTSDAVMVRTTSTPLSGVYTMNKNLPASSTNYTNFDALVDELACVGVSGPVTVNVVAGSGPYAGNFTFRNIPGASATNTVVFNGNGNVIGGLVSPLISFNNASYITLDSFNIAGDSGFIGTGIWVTNQSQYLTFNKNIINLGTTSTTSIGFAASGSSTAATTTGNNARYITFTNNEIIGGNYSFTLCGEASYLNNYGHYIANNKFRDFYSYGVYLFHADTVTLLNNDINRATRSTVTTLYGIYLNISRNLRIQKNRLHDFGTASYSAYPIYIVNCVNSPGYETEVSNNMIYNIGNTGIMYGIYSLTTAITGFNFYHNTIQYEVPGASTSAIRGAFFNVTTTNVNFKNNIIHITGAGSGVKTGIYVTNASTSFFSNNNIIRVATTAGTNNVGYWGAVQASLANWQAASLQDSISTIVDPVFSSIAGGNLTPLSANIDNMGVGVGITTDINGAARSATTPDIGAIEFTGIAGDLSIDNASLTRSSACYSTADTVKVTFTNLIGTTVDFAVDTLRIDWSVTGPVNSSGVIVVSSDTLGMNASRTVFVNAANLSTPGTYTLRANLRPNAINSSRLNDTLVTPVTLTVQPILSVAQRNFTVTSPTDTVVLDARSPIFPAGAFLFTEVCHLKTGTGSPSGGWPAYLLADDYLEISGVPNSDLGGYVLEQWNATTLISTHTFPTGTILSPNGTAIIAVGTLGASVNSPANYYYHGNGGYTGTFDSGITPTGRILKNPSGGIVDVVTYSGSTTYTFPTAAGVSPSEWTGIMQTSNGTAGIRLTGPDLNSPTNWVTCTTVLQQDPNTFNANVPTPSATGITGFTWSYLGNTIDTLPRRTVGPWTTPGVYAYVATYTNACGTYYDTVFVTATSTVPVQLLSFNAKENGNDVLLKWSSASEENVSHYEVYLSTNGTEFNAIGSIKAIGNSKVVQHYQFNHPEAMLTGSKTLYYKLNMVDADGKVEWSKTELIQLNQLDAPQIVVYPNPFQQTVTIKSADLSNLVVTITDLTGKVVIRETITQHNGVIELKQTEQLKTGIYIISTTQNGITLTQKLVRGM